jgi:transcriptional regulator with XRE-family HTH domain
MLRRMKLEEYLKRKNITCNAFAVRAGLDTSTVWRWLNQGSVPSAEHIELVCRLTRGRVTLSDWVRKDRRVKV